MARSDDCHADQSTVRVQTDNHEHDVAYYESGGDDPVTVFLHDIPT